jgi:hypothetical protein
MRLKRRRFLALARGGGEAAAARVHDGAVMRRGGMIRFGHNHRANPFILIFFYSIRSFVRRQPRLASFSRKKTE